MTQSRELYSQNIRNYITIVEQAQLFPVDEAVWDTLKKAGSNITQAVMNPGATWANRGQRTGARDLKNSVNQNFLWLGKQMGQSGITYQTLNFGHMRNFFKAPSNKIQLNDSQVDQIFDKVQQEFGLPDTEDDTPLNDKDMKKSQEIARSLLNHGISLAQSQRVGLAPTASQQNGASTAGTASNAQSPVSPATPGTPAATISSWLQGMTPKQQRYILQAVRQALGGTP